MRDDVNLVEKLLRFLRGPTPKSAEMEGGMISCQEALAVVHEYLDGELEPGSHERVRAHFEVCARCYPGLQTEEAFRAAVRRAEEGCTAPPELRERVLAALAGVQEDG